MVTPSRARSRAAVAATVVTLLVGSIAASQPASADPRSDQKEAQAAVAHASALLEGATARAQAAVQRLAAANAALPAAREHVADAQGAVAGATAAANTARREADIAQAKVDAAELVYTAQAAKVEDARQHVSAFIAATYRGAGLVTINALLSARSPQDLTVRSGYAERLVTDQQSAVAELVRQRGAAKDLANTAETARRFAAAARKKAERLLGAAKRAEAAALVAATTVARLISQRTDALGIARQERRATLARYQRAKANEARISAALRHWESHSGGPSWTPGARFIMPANGWKSSDFGYRYDPYFHVWQLHAGVDIAAPGGAPIYAAGSGQVIFAGWNGGYGNYTCISHGRFHGRGLSTCYGHQSALLVHPGQRVSAGEMIGRVGTTGASTGYHLHFEVRLNGNPVQPLPWLPSCFC